MKRPRIRRYSTTDNKTATKSDDLPHAIPP